MGHDDKCTKLEMMAAGLELFEVNRTKQWRKFMEGKLQLCKVYDQKTVQTSRVSARLC